MAAESDEHFGLASSNTGVCGKVNPSTSRFRWDKEQKEGNLIRSPANYISIMRFTNKDFNSLNAKVANTYFDDIIFYRIYESHALYFGPFSVNPEALPDEINIQKHLIRRWMIQESSRVVHHVYTTQKNKFSTKDFFSKCDQIRCFLRIWSHLLKKSLMENFIFGVVIEPLSFGADKEMDQRNKFKFTK